MQGRNSFAVRFLDGTIYHKKISSGVEEYTTTCYLLPSSSFWYIYSARQL